MAPAGDDMGHFKARLRPTRLGRRCFLTKAVLALQKGYLMTARCGRCEQDIAADKPMSLAPCQIKSVPHIDSSADPFPVEWEVRVPASSAKCSGCFHVEHDPGLRILRLCFHCRRELCIELEQPPKVLACGGAVGRFLRLVLGDHAPGSHRCPFLTEFGTHTALCRL